MDQWSIVSTGIVNKKRQLAYKFILEWKEVHPMVQNDIPKHHGGLRVKDFIGAEKISHMRRFHKI